MPLATDKQMVAKATAYWCSKAAHTPINPNAITATYVKKVLK